MKSAPSWANVSSIIYNKKHLSKRCFLLPKACLGLVALTGCATQTAFIQNGAKVEPAFSKSQSFYISGIGQENAVNAAEVCGGADKVAKVQSLQKPKDIGVTVLTLGIYTPHTAEVFCK